MATNPTTRRLASGALALLDARGRVTQILPLCPICGEHGHDLDDCQPYEGPTCSICDGLGHGYPGAGPCPLEDRGDYAGSQEEARDRYLEGLAERRQEDRLDARDEAKEWGGIDFP